MQRELYEVEKDRFDLKDSSLYHLQGTWPKDHKPEAVLDGEKLPAAISAQERVSALERFKDLDLVNGERVQMEICLPDLEGKKKLVVYAVKTCPVVFCFGSTALQETGKTAVLYREHRGGSRGKDLPCPWLGSL